MNHADHQLLAYVNQELVNHAVKQITAPASLVEHATKEGLDHARQVCLLAGVELVAIRMN